MATVSSHTLNGTDGSHAAGVEITLRDLATGETLHKGKTDEGGRLKLDVPADRICPGTVCEIVFAAGAYWARRCVSPDGDRIVDEVVVRFSMPDPDGLYHIPVILSPNAYSFWCSSGHG